MGTSTRSRHFDTISIQNLVQRTFLTAWQRLFPFINKRIQRKRLKQAKRKAVYTFIFGDHDDLKTPAVMTSGWDYICFTDNPALRSDVWDVRLSPRLDADCQLEEKKFAMKHMILFHHYLKGYDLSLSIGAQMEVNCNLDDFICEYFRVGDEMMICRHEERDCIYNEAEICKMLLLDDPERIDAHMQLYRAVGYPAHNGLYTTGIIARWHDRATVRSMCECWWEEYRGGSRRDQLSLNYAIWKSAPIRISAIDFNQQFIVKRNFIIHAHKRRIRFDGAKMSLMPDDTELSYSPQSILRITGPRYEGYLDYMNCNIIVGWVADRDRLNISIKVALYKGDTLLATVLANQLREDVGAHLGDNGLHGFIIPIPMSLKDGATHNVSIKVVDNEAISFQIHAFVLENPGVERIRSADA